ncbi:hypothetical protein AB0O86_37405 [Streptomyces hirsutus]|uniref:hypothetical protein n=1 Tax=Streptomyces hirsutus TaxID=35620 RepID=UPI0034449113
MTAPSAVVRAAMSAAWHAHLQQVDTGWLDMGFALPTLDTTRARTELNWAPTKDGPQVLAEVVEGMREAASGRTPCCAHAPSSARSATRSVAGRSPCGGARDRRRGPDTLWAAARARVARRRPPRPGSHGLMLAMGPGFCSELVLLRAPGEEG